MQSMFHSQEAYTAWVNLWGWCQYCKFVFIFLYTTRSSCLKKSSVFPLPQGFPYQFTLHVQCGSSLIYPNIILMFNILFSCQFRLVSDFCLSACTKIYSLNVSISTLLSKTMELKSYCSCGIFPTVSQDIVNDL